MNLHGTLSNVNGIGARVAITSTLGTQIRDIKSGDGFRYMSFLGAHFGLGDDELVEQVTVYWPSGTVDVITDVAVNEVLDVTESLSTATAELPATAYTVSPNPASDRITIAGELSGATAILLDGAGRVVLRANAADGAIDVSRLATGSYVLNLVTAGGTWKERITKL